MKTLITGATGFVGRQLVARLEQPHVLSRDPERARSKLGDVQAFAWPEPEKAPPPADAFAGVDTVLHLAGEPVADGRWTKARKQRILASRELGTRNLVQALRELPERPRVLVSASAVGFYGDCGDQLLAEDAAPGDDFLAEVCQAWEREARAAEELGMRVVCLRIGIVLGQGGGALAKMLTPFKMGVGGRLGNGKQYMPWVHVDDVVGLFLHAATNEQLSGPLNTSPEPVTNLEFTKTLGRVLHRPTIFPVPGFALKLAFGQFGEVLLGSQRTDPGQVLASGYSFEHDKLEQALRAILRPEAAEQPAAS